MNEWGTNYGQSLWINGVPDMINYYELMEY